MGVSVISYRQPFTTCGNSAYWAAFRVSFPFSSVANGPPSVISVPFDRYSLYSWFAYGAIVFAVLPSLTVNSNVSSVGASAPPESLVTFLVSRSLARFPI